MMLITLQCTWIAKKDLEMAILTSPASIFDKTSEESVEPSSEDTDTIEFSSIFFSTFLFFLFPFTGPIAN